MVDVRLSEFQAGKSHPFHLHASTLAFGVIPGPSERWDEVEERVDAFLGWLATQPGRILVVTHGVVVRYAQQKLSGPEVVPFRLAAGLSINELYWIITWWHCAHLCASWAEHSAHTTQC